MPFSTGLFAYPAVHKAGSPCDRCCEGNSAKREDRDEGGVHHHNDSVVRKKISVKI